MSLIQRQEEAYQVPFEIESLQKLVASKDPKCIVEIGSAKGGTLPRWLFTRGVKIIISVDLPGGLYGGISAQEKELLGKECAEYAVSNNKIFHQILGDSHDKATYNILNTTLKGEKIDFLFIDGDHSFEGVLQDFEMYSGLVKEGGLIGFHDIIDSKFHRKHRSYVQGLWHKIKKYFTYTEFITDDKEEYKRIMSISYPTGFGGIGVIEYNSSALKKFISQQNLRKNPGRLALTSSQIFRTNRSGRRITL